MDINLVVYPLARRKIRDGDLLLFRRRRRPGSSLIAAIGRSDYSHAAMAAWWQQRLMCLETVQFRGGRAVTTLRLPSREPGEYAIVARVSLDGNDAFELSQSQVVPTTEWLGNTLGLADKVLPPWTPMTLDRDTLACWGRTYRFGDSPLPVQITSAGKELRSLLADRLTDLLGPERGP